MTRTLSQELDLIKTYAESAPVQVIDLASSLGLAPVAEPMDDHVCGLIRRKVTTPTGYQVAFNSRHALNRQRFTVAHEIGHYMFHRDLLGEGVGDTLAYRDDGSGMPNSHIGPTEERQANTFAANLLMPSHLISELRAQGVVSPLDLARRLQVSEAAMRVRLGLPPRKDLFD